MPPCLRRPHRVDPGAEPRHLLLPRMPAFRLRALIEELAAGRIRATEELPIPWSIQRHLYPVNDLAIPPGES